MATEEQTTYSAYANLGAGDNADKIGQRLTISNRIVSKLGFWLKKRGSPTTEVLTFEIRKVSDHSVICSKEWGLAADLGVDVAYKEVTFDTPTYINEEVRILASIEPLTEADGAYFANEHDDVKGGEYRTHIVHYPGENWIEQETWDAAYIYTYTAPSASPTVTTQAVTAISGTTAIGNGNVTSLGDAPVTQHGHCWNTTGTPDTGDNKTENGAKAATGAFTSSLTSLTAGTKYYDRAYAINSVGTSYGNEVVFWADKGTVFPTEAITRVTNLIHRYNRAQGVYTLEINLGEVTSDFGLPEWLTRPQAAVPEVLEEPVVERERTKEEITREQDSRLYREADRMRREAEERREEMLAESKEKDSRLWEANKRLKREAEEKERKLREEVERLQATAHPLVTREGNYVCPHCKARFNTAIALARHIESVHPRGTAYGRGIYGGGL